MSGEIVRDAAVGFGLVAAFATVLRGFYSAFESNWPQQYFGGSRGVDPVISRTLPRYLAFRFGPVFLTAVAAGTVAARLSLPRAPVVIGVVTVHLLSGSLRGFVQALRDEPPNVARATYRLIAVAVCAVAVAAALVIGDKADPYVPTAKEVSSSFWIALAVFAAAYVGRSLSASRPNEDELLARATRGVPSAIVAKLGDAPISYPQAAVAIAFAEHLNRPAWARRMERYLRPRNGTYGLMQMSAHKPLTDEQSVKLFLERVVDYPTIVAGDYPNARPFILHHNDDAAFADLAESFFVRLQSREG